LKATIIKEMLIIFKAVRISQMKSLAHELMSKLNKLNWLFSSFY
jgi:hypothetical protein